MCDVYASPDYELPREDVVYEALDYMEKQLRKHKLNFERESARGASEDVLRNIELKIGYYETALAVRKEDEGK